MSDCNTTTQIDENLCIGDSLAIINTNFSNLDSITCNLSSSQTSLISELRTYSLAFNNSTVNMLNLMHNASAISVVTLNPPIVALTVVTGGSNVNGSGVFTNTIPNTAKFILFRGDIPVQNWSDINELRNFKIEGVSIYTKPIAVSGLTYLYTAIPYKSSYGYTWSNNSSSQSTYNLRIVGYY
jgi:hypothetical protein